LLDIDRLDLLIAADEHLARCVIAAIAAEFAAGAGGQNRAEQQHSQAPCPPHSFALINCQNRIRSFGRLEQQITAKPRVCPTELVQWAHHSPVTSWCALKRWLTIGAAP